EAFPAGRQPVGDRVPGRPRRHRGTTPDRSRRPATATSGGGAAGRGAAGGRRRGGRAVRGTRSCRRTGRPGCRGGRGYGPSRCFAFGPLVLLPIVRRGPPGTTSPRPSGVLALPGPLPGLLPGPPGPASLRLGLPPVLPCGRLGLDGPVKLGPES